MSAADDRDEFGSPLKPLRPIHLQTTQTEPPLVMVDSSLDAADLYKDLCSGDGVEGSLFMKTQVAELQERAQDQESTIARLTATVNKLTAQVSELEEDKSVLMRNISSLYMTARLEIQRKEVEIKELRERIDLASQPKQPNAEAARPAQPRQSLTPLQDAGPSRRPNEPSSSKPAQDTPVNRHQAELSSSDRERPPVSKHEPCEEPSASNPRRQSQDRERQERDSERESGRSREVNRNRDEQPRHSRRHQHDGERGSRCSHTPHRSGSKP